MGWTFRHKGPNVTAKEEVIRELTCENEHGSWKVLACEIKGHAAYCASEIIKKDEQGKLLMDTRIVIGTVVAIEYARKDHYNFGTKVMDEDMGPYFYDCPARILNLLTPTKSEYAQKWREECRRQIAKKTSTPRLEYGDVLVFPFPLSFGKHGKESNFTCVDSKKLHFLAGFGLCRLRRDTLKRSNYEHHRNGTLLATITT
jgi:hypothetical protein